MGPPGSLPWSPRHTRSPIGSSRSTRKPSHPSSRHCGFPHPGSGTLVEETYLEGKAEGKAEDILRALQVRGPTVSDSVREPITTCTDLDTLTSWFDRSLTATTAEDVLKEGPTVPTDASEQP
ncbi:hypothetical protein [Streptomyces sp. TE5632]